ncbi:hypothetical protein U1Q18_036634, partial [Sarracenia purpurea var. burkii]
MANLPSAQLSALENMHYSHMIRFDNVEEARRLQLLIDKLKQSKTRELEAKIMRQECCSETDTEGNDISPNGSDTSSFQETSKTSSVKSQSRTRVEERKDDLPLISLLHSRKNSTQLNTAGLPVTSKKATQDSPKSMPIATDSQQIAVGRKRIRVIVSDGEDEMHDGVECPMGRHHKGQGEDVATSDEVKNGDNMASPACEFQDVSAVASKCATSICTPVNLEESTCSYKTRSPTIVAQDAKEFRTSSTTEAVKNSNFDANDSKYYADVTQSLSHNHDASRLNEHACVDEYGHMKCGGRALETLEGIDTLMDHLRGKGWIEVSIE